MMKSPDPISAKRILFSLVIWVAAAFAPLHIFAHGRVFEIAFPPGTKVSRVVVSEVTATLPNHVQLTISTYDPVGETRNLAVVERIESVSEVVPLMGEHVAVIGKLHRGGNRLLIVDTEVLRMVGSGRGFNFTISPTGQYLAYWSWHAKMVTPDYRRSILLVFDLARSDELAADAALNPVPIFPEINARDGSLDVTLEERHSWLSPFLWSEDGQRLYFVEFDSGETQENLVCVDLTDGVDSPDIRLLTIDVVSLANLEAMTQESLERFLEKPLIWATSLEWEGPNIIQMTPFPDTRFPQEILIDVTEMR